MNIENVPLIASFNRQVEKLPPEHRSKAYEIAESFLCVGAMHGALGTSEAIAILSRAISGSDSMNVPEKSERDQQSEYYLQTKAKENRT